MGDVNVGKTNIIRRLLGEEFREYEATIGVDFSEYLIKDIDKEDKNIELSVQIWDTCKKLIIRKYKYKNKN
jgi:GTPase SAR1 family protein